MTTEPIKVPSIIHIADGQERPLAVHYVEIERVDAKYAARGLAERATFAPPPFDTLEEATARSVEWCRLNSVEFLFIRTAGAA